MDGQPDQREPDPQKAADSPRSTKRLPSCRPKIVRCSTCTGITALAKTRLPPCSMSLFRTVKRRWLSAKLLLGQSLGKEFLP